MPSLRSEGFVFDFREVQPFFADMKIEKKRLKKIGGVFLLSGRHFEINEVTN